MPAKTSLEMLLNMVSTYHAQYLPTLNAFVIVCHPFDNGCGAFLRVRGRAAPFLYPGFANIGPKSK